MRCSGLFVITPMNEVMLLNARRSYATSKQHQRNQIDFLEKISIPRGKWDSCDIFDYETAVREFIEETARVFDSAYVYRVPFLLEWKDNNVVYKYRIYVAIMNAGVKMRCIEHEPNSFCVKLMRNTNFSYNVRCVAKRQTKEMSRNLYILPLENYYNYMRERQLCTYEDSNYLSFFDFVKHVQTQFAFNSDKFFKISLTLKEWQKKTPESVMTASQEATCTRSCAK